MLVNTEEILARIAQDKRIQRTLPHGGRLHMDRSLPFLAVYRYPSKRLDHGMMRLAQAESAYLITPTGESWTRWGARLLESITGSLVERFGGVLLLEIWASPDSANDQGDNSVKNIQKPEKPKFRVLASEDFVRSETVDCLLTSLEKIRVTKQTPLVSFDTHNATRPKGFKPLLSKKVLADKRIHIIGLEIAPVYRSPETGELFPPVLRELRRGMARSLNRTFYVYSRSHTSISPNHYYTLGRRTLGKSVRDADHILAQVENSFDPLVLATPMNAKSAWLKFKRSRFDKAPMFNYRPSQVDSAVLKRKLFSAPVERIDDPTLAFLFRQKQDELDRQITSINDIGTPKFLSSSLQIYGGVSDQLLDLAKTLLERVPPRGRSERKKELFNAHEIARLVRKEIEHYKSIDPELNISVEIREDLFSGMMVSRGRLLIGSDMSASMRRIEALVQHEVGTHLVTYHNGKSQPLQQLALGLAGYDGLQEGLAVLAEYFVDGMSRYRLRLLAARVIAVHAMLDGASFIDTFRLINRYYGFRQQTAYLVAMRVFRGGGLTKDAVYLRGLVQMLDYLHNGGDMDLLWTGKIAAEHIPFIDELHMRKILKEPVLKPTFLNHPAYASKLERLRLGLNVFDLLTTSKAA